MVKLWYMDNNPEDQRLEHHLAPPQFADLEKIKIDTGILYWKIDPSSKDGDAALAKLKSDRGYTYEDIMEVSKDTLPNYEEKAVNDLGCDSDSTSQCNYLLFEPLNTQESSKVSSSEGYFKEAIRDNNFTREIEMLQAQRKLSIISENRQENEPSIEYRNADFSLGLTPEHNSDNADINNLINGIEFRLEKNSSRVGETDRDGLESHYENRILKDIGENISNTERVSIAYMEIQNKSDIINEVQLASDEAQYFKNTENLNRVENKFDSNKDNQRHVTEDVIFDNNSSEKSCNNAIQNPDDANEGLNDFNNSKGIKVLDSPECIVLSREAKFASIPNILVQNCTIQSMYPSSPDSPDNIYNGYQPKEFCFVMNASTKDVNQHDSISFSENVSDNILGLSQNTAITYCDNAIKNPDEANEQVNDFKNFKVTNVLDFPDCFVLSREAKFASIPDILVQNCTKQSMIPSSPDSPVNIHNGYQPKEFRFVLNASPEDISQNDSVSISINISDNILGASQTTDITRSNDYSTFSNSSNETTEKIFLNPFGKMRSRITSTPIKSGDFYDIKEQHIENDDDTSSCFSDEVSPHNSRYDGDGEFSSYVIVKDTDIDSRKQRSLLGFQCPTSDGEDDKESTMKMKKTWKKNCIKKFVF